MNNTAAHQELVAAALVALSAQGHLVWAITTGVLPDGRGGFIRTGRKGREDIGGILAPSGRYLALEAKTGTGRQRAEQKQRQVNVERVGGVYILFRSVDDLFSRLPA